MSIIGYHACRNTGSLNKPFLSKEHPKTWLTQGYYFWTDSPTSAHFWGEVGIKGEYAVLEFAIDFQSDEYLDLVGNVKHIEYFELLAKTFIEIYKEETVTIRKILLYFRKKEKEVSGAFPFLGIKASDSANEGYPFVENMKEKIFFLKKQQLCVFEEAETKINFIDKIYPTS